MKRRVGKGEPNPFAPPPQAREGGDNDAENVSGDAAQHDLSAAFAYLRALLERHVARAEGNGDADVAAANPPAFAATPGGPLARLCAVLRLSPFERDLLLLCASVELDSSMAALCARAQANPSAAPLASPRLLPTFSLALAMLPDAHWSAIHPDAPLRRFGFVRFAGASDASVQPPDVLTLAPLRIEETVLHALLGLPSGGDERLRPYVEWLPPPPGDEPHGPSEAEPAREIGAAWAAGQASPLPMVLLAGGDEGARRAVACRAAPASVAALPVTALLSLSATERDAVLRAWERDALLAPSQTLLLEISEDGDAVASPQRDNLGALLRRVGELPGRVIVSVGEREQPRVSGLISSSRPRVVVNVRRADRDEQRTAWRRALFLPAGRDEGENDDALVDTLVGQFDLNADAIASVAHSAALGATTGTETRERLWDACRSAARPRLEELAQRVEGGATWDDLLLPPGPHQLLRDVAAHTRARMTVSDAWGFGGKNARGLGISALFAGPSGTGKTLAAEVLANELRLDLYRIDLSALVSKYIGETEKNLRRVFDAAEAGGALLLFDEADALFGKRSEVKDSHDRYANIEVSYLLQRMECYRGLAILTTNQKSALDTAFLRRLRFAVTFPFPDAVQRARIWARAFPPETPTLGLDPAKLALLNVTGGNIRMMALYAASLAADQKTPVQMSHLLRAARAEYAKLEKPLPAAEVMGWAVAERQDAAS